MSQTRCADKDFIDTDTAWLLSVMTSKIDVFFRSVIKFMKNKTKIDEMMMNYMYKWVIRQVCTFYLINKLW